MKNLSTYLPEFQDSLPVYDDATFKMKRALTVQRIFKEAIEKIYKENSELILSHVNAVYIKKDTDLNLAELIIYADDSIVRADIDARQEFIKYVLFSHGETITSCKIIASRGNIKTHQPFVEKQKITENRTQDIVYSSNTKCSLSDDELKEIQRVSKNIEDNKLSKTFQKAMRANLESHK